MFILGYFGGLFNPIDEMPGSLQFIAHLMPNYHQVSLVVASVDGHSVALSHWLVLAGSVALLGLAVTLKHRFEETRGFV